MVRRQPGRLLHRSEGTGRRAGDAALLPRTPGPTAAKWKVTARPRRSPRLVLDALERTPSPVNALAARPGDRHRAGRPLLVPVGTVTVEVFDFDIDTDGARVVVRLHPICPGCRTDREVDATIKLPKGDLDAVAGRMKAALQVQAHKSLTG
jgi:hypothetical protein